MIGSKATAMQASTPVEMKRGSSMRRHVPFLAMMVIYILFSLFTIRDFPTVDRTIDDMWNLDWVMTLLHEGKAHQTVNLLPVLNEVVVPFNWNTVTSAIVYKDIEPSIFAIRVKNLLFGIALLVLLYGFAVEFFGNESMGLAAVISAGFTNAILYRSHDARGDILTAFLFFIMFLVSYRIIFSDPVKLWAVFFFPFVVLLTFRHAHPNGGALGLAAFLTILTMRPRLIKVPKVWGALFGGLATYVTYEVILGLIIAQVFPVAHGPADASRTLAQQYQLSDYLIMLPAGSALHGHGISGVFKSLFHLVGLILKFPLRMTLRIDRKIPIAYVDIALMGLTVVALVVQGLLKRSFSRPQKFLMLFLLYYWICFAFVGAPTNDYTVYLMPFFVLLLLSSIRAIAERQGFSWRPVVTGLVAAQVILVVAVLLNIKFGYRYYDNYVKLDSAVSALIPANSRVLAGAVYFTMMKPTKPLEFYEIFKSAGPIMKMEDHYFAEAHYSFAESFLKKRFQYVIYDENFDTITRRVGFGIKGRKSFPDSLLGGYDVIWHTATSYPAIKAIMRNVTIYRLRGDDSVVARAAEPRDGGWRNLSRMSRAVRSGTEARPPEKNVRGSALYAFASAPVDAKRLGADRR
jgi:hypothetical protein